MAILLPAARPRLLLLRGSGARAEMAVLLVAAAMICLGVPVFSQDEDAATNPVRLVQGGLSCSPGGSDLSAQLRALKQSLSARASVSLYYAQSSGDIDPSSGYGASVMYQCRGDLALSDCATCVKAAFSTLNQGCPNPGFAQVELQACGVIYSNQTIEGGYYYTLTNLKSSANGSTSFLVNKDIAVANVTKQVLQNKRNLGTYWAVNVVGDGTVDACYALAQCHGYLPPSDCTYCLSLALSHVNNFGNTLGGRSYIGSCYIRYENYIMYTNNTPSILTSLGPSSAPSSSPSPLGTTPIVSTPGKSVDLRFATVIVVVAGLVFFVVGSLLGWFSRRIYSHRNQVSNPSDFWKIKAEDTGQYSSLQHASIQHFSRMQIEKATDNFNLERKIGEGGFGAVYLGILDNGVKVAVKKLMHLSDHGREQFLIEAKLIKSLQHRNLVRLIGCSIEWEDDSRFLVYEYVPNQNLDKLLFASHGREILTWTKRRGILEGVAKGLTYLHHDSHQPVIHRNIKAANILLDDDFQPKIADFGLARLFASDKTHMSTSIAGTLGYIAPEYALSGHVSTKSDVFSFGLLMLEVISGRRIFEESLPPDQQYLLHLVWRLHQEGRELEILDGEMKQDWVEEEMKRFIRVSLLCCQTYPSQRPSMIAVLEMLIEFGSVIDIPTMPTYLSSMSTFSHQYA